MIRKIPVTVLAGGLGSGKTPLLIHLLALEHGLQTMPDMNTVMS